MMWDQLAFYGLTLIVGIFIGIFIGGAANALILRRYHARSQRRSLGELLNEHFLALPDYEIEVHAREFPYRACVDAYAAVTEWIESHCRVNSLLGVPVAESFMSSLGIGTLLSPTHEGYTYYPTALEYDSFDVGDGETRTCVAHALWLLEHEGERLAVLWTSTTTHAGCGFQTKLRLNLAHPRRGALASTEKQFFDHVESGIESARTYRGKVLSLENSSDYRGHSGGIVVHTIKPITREELVLPDSTIQLLERNIVRFIRQRSELAKLQLPTKKGVLLYGPPGTGKTFTIHYLINSLENNTTLLVTAEQVGMLEEYIALARLLQPSILVLEDVDLIGRERNGVEIARESLLNRLLNEMDGLRADAEILFLLTTNRPESLESALAARPGRVDQAVEFPLPDEAGRRKLVRLYASGAEISEDVVRATARVTTGVSASFIKELMRRSIQFHLECRVDDAPVRILQNDVDQAIEELLFAGGLLNRSLLGAERDPETPGD